jgi:transcription termination factor Rho
VTEATQTIATSDSSTTTTTAAKRGAGSGVSAMLLPELKALAGQLGISGASGMRKADLVAAINARQVGGPSSGGTRERPARGRRASSADQSRDDHGPETPRPDGGSTAARSTSTDDSSQRPDARAGAGAGEQRGERPDRGRPRDGQQQDRQQSEGSERADRQGSDRRQGNDRQGNDRQGNDRQGGDRQQNGTPRAAGGGDRDFDDEGSGGRGRRSRRRGRDRYRDDRGNRGRGNRYESEPEIAEDDVLLPVAGILDVLDSYAFVRTSGYLPGSNDVYLSLSMVRKHGLRKGDAVTGAVRQPREGEKQQKFNPMVRVDTVNGAEPDATKSRVEFNKLTPLYPQERLRLETDQNNLVTRVIDLVAPIGKGQRGLIVSPPKAGKTMVLQAIANAITVNNPEVHLMVVLVDE